MNVVRCSNGHYYDEDQFATCPHCGTATCESKGTAAEGGKEKKKGLFGHKSKGSITSRQSTAGVGTSSSREIKQTSKTGNEGSGKLNSFGNGQSETLGMRRQESSSKEEIFKKGTTLDFGATRDFWDSSLDAKETEDESGQNHDEEKQERNDKTNEKMNVSENETKHKDQGGESLREKVRNASASSEGKTTSYFSAITSKDSAQDENKKQRTIDPVVGWLVCISGACFGESFSIGEGTNSIGRSASNRIALEGEDTTISRDKHAFITYEPKHRQFYIKPGEERGLTYVNNDFLESTKPLSSRSIIEFGHSRYLFVPLCGADFTWEDYLNNQG